jgi:thymidylate synthase
MTINVTLMIVTNINNKLFPEGYYSNDYYSIIQIMENYYTKLNITYMNMSRKRTILLYTDDDFNVVFYWGQKIHNDGEMDKLNELQKKINEECINITIDKLMTKLIGLEKYFGDIFVIGSNAEIVNSVINNTYCNKIYHVKLMHNIETDGDDISNTLMTLSKNKNYDVKVENKSKRDVKVYDKNAVQSDNVFQNEYEIDIDIHLHTYDFINKEEIQYLDLMKKIIDEGDERETRNAKTLSLFGEKLVFDMDNGFPLLTTKKMFYNGIFEELLFFLRGDTDTKILNDKGVKIWKKNTSKEFIKNNNKNLEEYDMGPMYGFQWRHFNAEYKGCKHNYKNEGIDQLKNVIDLLATDPYSRRITMTTYNPLQCDDGVLHACHGLTTQFYVEKNRISLQTYQRSADVFLGLPFNIASYSLMLHIVVHLVNNHPSNYKNHDYKPGKMTIVLGDAHLYSDDKCNHIDAAKVQLERYNKTYKFPTIEINGDIKTLNDLNHLTAKDVVLHNYISHDKITAEMSE